MKENAFEASVNASAGTALIKSNAFPCTDLDYKAQTLQVYCENMRTFSRLPLGIF